MKNSKSIQKSSTKIVKKDNPLWNKFKDIDECLIFLATYVKRFADAQFDVNQNYVKTFGEIYKSLSVIMQGVEACMQRITSLESKLA